MNDIELKLCDIQGRLFELSVERQLKSASFIKVFMNSETSKALDSTYNRMQWAGEEYLLEEVVDAAGDKVSKGGEIYSKDLIYWIGYIYRYFVITYELTSMQVYKIVKPKELKGLFLPYHTMDPSQAIERILEAKGMFIDEETELQRQYEIFKRIRMSKKDK